VGAGATNAGAGVGAGLAGSGGGIKSTSWAKRVEMALGLGATSGDCVVSIRGSAGLPTCDEGFAVAADIGTSAVGGGKSLPAGGKIVTLSSMIATSVAGFVTVSAGLTSTSGKGVKMFLTTCSVWVCNSSAA
jgi:hypothetical protein